MPNWKKILLNGGDGELTTLKLTNLTEDSTGTKILTLDSSNNIKLTASFSGGGGGTVTGVTGTAPIVSSGGTTPAISINAATTSAAGSMSSADKTKKTFIPLEYKHQSSLGKLPQFYQVSNVSQPLFEQPYHEYYYNEGLGDVAKLIGINIKLTKEVK